MRSGRLMRRLPVRSRRLGLYYASISRLLCDCPRLLVVYYAIVIF